MVLLLVHSFSIVVFIPIYCDLSFAAHPCVIYIQSHCIGILRDRK